MRPQPRRGDLWWCETRDHGRRPGVVLTRDVAIPRMGRTLVALGTTTIRNLASEVLLEPGEDPVPSLIAINLDSIESVVLDDLVERMGRLSHLRMLEICAALEVAVGCSA